MYLPCFREYARVQVSGFGPSASAWLSSVGKTAGAEAIELFAPKATTRTPGQKEPAELAEARMSFPTAPPVNLGAAALMALQGDDGSAAGSAGGSNAGIERGESETVESSAAEQFLDYMQKTPEERLRDKILKALGITEEDIASMTPDERVALEEKIRDIIKETMVKAEGDAAPERDQANATADYQQFMLELL